MAVAHQPSETSTVPQSPPPALTVLYRGPLSSCNYECHYCPFAKHHETAAELRVDRGQLERFCKWVAKADRQMQIQFTPWGEALVRRWYREAMQQLSHMDHVVKVAVQTNISCDLQWLTGCNLDRVALWCTWHPTQATRAAFLAQTRRLDAIGVRYSVGVVGLREYCRETELLRGELPPDVYLWVNAYKDQPDYYDDADVLRWEKIDPLFRINNRRHASLGRGCRAGETAVSIDGQGNVRRCHFIKQPIGNIYQQDLDSMLRPCACTNATCGCHIGYVHLKHLGLDRVFADGLLERIPATPIWRQATERRSEVDVES